MAHKHSHAFVFSEWQEQDDTTFALPARRPQPLKSEIGRHEHIVEDERPARQTTTNKGRLYLTESNEELKDLRRLRERPRSPQTRIPTGAFEPASQRKKIPVPPAIAIREILASVVAQAPPRLNITRAESFSSLDFSRPDTPLLIDLSVEPEKRVPPLPSATEDLRTLSLEPPIAISENPRRGRPIARIQSHDTAIWKPSQQPDVPPMPLDHSRLSKTPVVQRPLTPPLTPSSTDRLHYDVAPTSQARDLDRISPPESIRDTSKELGRSTFEHDDQNSRPPIANPETVAASVNVHLGHDQDEGRDDNEKPVMESTSDGARDGEEDTASLVSSHSAERHRWVAEEYGQFLFDLTGDQRHEVECVAECAASQYVDANPPTTEMQNDDHPTHNLHDDLASGPPTAKDNGVSPDVVQPSTPRQRPSTSQSVYFTPQHGPCEAADRDEISTISYRSVSFSTLSSFKMPETTSASKIDAKENEIEEPLVSDLADIPDSAALPAIYPSGVVRDQRLSQLQQTLSPATSFDSAAPPPIALARHPAPSGQGPVKLRTSTTPSIPSTTAPPKKLRKSRSFLTIFKPAHREGMAKESLSSQNSGTSVSLAVPYISAPKCESPIQTTIPCTAAASIPTLFSDYRGAFPSTTTTRDSRPPSSYIRVGNSRPSSARSYQTPNTTFRASQDSIYPWHLTTGNSSNPSATSLATGYSTCFDQHSNQHVPYDPWNRPRIATSTQYDAAVHGPPTLKKPVRNEQSGQQRSRRSSFREKWKRFNGFAW